MTFTNIDDVVGVLRAAGVTVHETPGWMTRGYDGQDLVQIRGILWHHTATNRAQFAGNPSPTTKTLVEGRSDLAGPLCNLQFNRDGSVTVIATGVANHAGKGSAPGIPKDAGNHYLIGIEAESSGIAPWDWTPEQLHWAPIVGAALEGHYLKDLPADQRLQLGHLEYSSEGKIDPAGWPGGMDGLRASINAVLNDEGDDMPLTDADVDKLFNAKVPRQGGMKGDTSLKGMIGYNDTNLGRIINLVTAQDATIKGLAGAVKALAGGEQFDEGKLLASIAETVKAATAEGVAAGIESIDTTVTLQH